MGIRLPKGIDKTLTYYLGGPMSNIAEFNYPYFRCTKKELMEQGLIIESPHENPWPTSNETDEELWQYMMRSALKQLLHCNGLILLKGWPSSRGAVIEASIASALRMPMYFLDGDYLVAMHPVKDSI